MNHLTKNAFPEVRTHTDPDVVEMITQVLRDAGHATPEAWKTDELILEAKPAAPKLQIFLINRYWRRRFALSPADTMVARFCLQDREIEPVEYVKVFKEHVAPVIVANNC